MSLRMIFVFAGIYIAAFPMVAQDEIRLGITKTDVSQFELKKSTLESLLQMDLSQPNALTTISDKLVSAYTNDPGFKVIDFRAYNLVSAERERQKSEEFIDGYIVEQGKSEGANFILSPIYLATDNEISIRVFDVVNGNLVCSASTPIIKGKTGPEYTRYYSALLIQQLNNRCFNVQYPVVRALKEKGGEAKEILVAYGHASQAKEKQVIGIYVHRSEMVNGAEVERQVLLGEGIVEVVEDDNFSTVSIRKGGAEILTELQQSGTLFIRLLKIEK